MKRILAVMLLLIGTVLACNAQDAGAAQPGIPVPTGAKVVTEMNVDREQIATQLNSLLSIGVGDKVPPVDEGALRQALGGLERVMYSEMKLDGAYSAGDVLALFEKQLNGRRVLWSTYGPVGSGVVLIATDDGGYFGARLAPDATKDGKVTGGKITAFRTYGFIDVASAVKLAVPVLKSTGMLPGLPNSPKHK